ncbi:MAG: hypothetical protein E7604_02220 [Ruminococcaceae bacterium]|nr:hypothetical protein [Oscillospiraceae bacterium]
MLKTERVSVMNLENALRGMRNPMNSWDKSDSFFDDDGHYVVGEADLSLAGRLARSGSDHRKYLRQIFVSVDITAPLYWWKEFDTYKVATVANSTSTMHKIHAKPFSRDDFSTDHMDEETLSQFDGVIAYLEVLRTRFMETKDKRYWYDMIQFLPSSYDQMRTVTLNYETLTNIYYARRHHKLDEWHIFCDMIAALPYAEQLICCHDEAEAH